MKSVEIAELIKKTGLDFAMDEFSGKVINRKRQLIQNIWVEEGPITDPLFSTLQMHLERKYDKPFSINKIREALNMIAVEEKFNEPAKRFDSYEKKWDGVHRLDTLGTVFFGNSNANEAIRLMLLYMVAGAYGATVNWQYTLDFIGRQGTGKTQFLKKIGGEYYTDQITSFRDKDSLEVMSGSLLVNDDEMLVSSGKSAIEFKKFVSSTKLTFRASYGYVSQTHRRRFVIARTTNDFSYIKDLTGNRRIVPIIVYENERKRHPATITELEAQKIIGEAVHEYDWDELMGESRKFDRQIGEVMAETIEELSSDGDFVDRVRKFVELQNESFTKKEVLQFLTSNDPNLLEGNSVRFLNKKIVDVLSSMGYREKVTKQNGKAKRVMVDENAKTVDATRAKEIFSGLQK
ncbi:hypothetical protein H7198_01735 [Fructobacillus sp. CRL 2054]|uniref:VapE domain-containing protein n=1 Tax=Fructobacillus sp. CRL 2054 TaxID=2763007 RepID=UPI002379D86C|nr:VapE domain-containing protein [Fructobacillus sp. CRL 2054]MDD9138334.1 hypothetical protein [Fructobacillus sp. CRL 2054]